MLVSASSTSNSASSSHPDGGDSRTLRVVLLGPEGTLGMGPGKSTLVERFLSGKYTASLPPNKVAGVRARAAYVLKGQAGLGGGHAEGWKIAVQFIELPSARNALATAAPVHLPTADAVVYVYDTADRKTLDGLPALHALAATYARPEVSKSSTLLVGTKADLGRDRKVPALDAVRLGLRLGLPVFECSALTGVNVEAALASLVRRAALRLALAATDLPMADAVLQHLPVPNPVTHTPEPPTDAGGASVSPHDDAFTLLHHACRLGASDAVRALLLRKGADANPHDARGRIPLHIAVLHAHVPCVRALLRATTPANTTSSASGSDGACEVTALDNAGRSPLALAELLGNAELISLLSKAQAAYLYAEAMHAGSAAPFKSRVALIGAGGAGKTALWRALRGLSRKDPVSGRSPLRTVLFEESRTTLAQLEQLPDPHEGRDAEQQLLTPNSHGGLIAPGRIRSWQRTLSGSSDRSSSSSSSLDDSGEYGLQDGGTCAAFTVQLIQTLLGMRGRQRQQEERQQRAWAAVACEAHPLASPHLYPNASEEEAGDVAVHCWEVAGGADAEAVPLQPLLLEGSDVLVLCFDLVRAQLNREEALRELAYFFAALDSQEHRPGTPRAGVVSPGRQGGKGPVFHRRDILLVGTFRDALTVSPEQEEEDGEEADAQRVRVLEDLNLAICQRLATFEAFARLRVPHAARAKGRVFFAVGADPAAQGDELGPLRRALCKAVARNGALRRSRPAMWLRFLEEIRAVPRPGSTTGGITSPGSPIPPPTGPSPFRRALSREQCRQVADRLAYEFTNRPVAPEAFALMLRLLGEMGEVMVLDVGDGSEQQVVLPRREYAFHLYRKVVERCREAELSPRRRAASPRAASPPFSSGSPPPADLHPAVQRLRATGRIAVESLRALLGPEDGAYVEIAIRAFERAELGVRLSTADAEGGADEVFLPGIPLAQNEDDFAVAAFDSPAGAMCDAVGGRVVCYFAFREALVPKGLLARLLLAGMRPTAHALGGLRFAHRHWGPPSTLAKDHAELPLDGYTLALTVDRAQSRLRCALLLQDGRAVTPGMEAQVGLTIQDMLEALRKQHHARFRLDLLVADRASRQTFDFVGDVLLAHKRRLRDRRGGIEESPRPAPDAASPDPRPLKPQGSSNRPAAFRFGQEEGEGEGEHGEVGEEGGDDDAMGHVLHWASVMTTAPATAFRPLPRALLSSSATEPPKGVVGEDVVGPSWLVQPLIGRLSALLPPHPDAKSTTTPQRPEPHILAPHPGGPRRRNKASAYAALLPPAYPTAAQALWRLEPVPSTRKPGAVGGFRLRLHRPGCTMDGWGLGLSTAASEKRHLGQVYAVLCADAARAATWSCDPKAKDNTIRLRWGDAHRFLSEGAHDARLHEVRFVVLTPEAALRRGWGFDPLEPSAKPAGPSAASLLDDTNPQGKPHQRRSSRAGSITAAPGAIAKPTAAAESDSEEEEDALALRPQESAGDDGEDGEDGEEEQGEANSPEVRRVGGVGAIDAAAAAALREVASALTLDDGED